MRLMPSLPLYQVDAFTDRPFAGNPAAICPLEAAISETLMQDIAAENNLSETAFFVPGAGDIDLRWFTPTVEVDLCGHATLASAFVLMTDLEPGRSEVVFRTRSGALPVRRDGDLFVLDFPRYSPAPESADVSAQVAAAMRASPLEVLRARALYAVLDSAEAVQRLDPDLAAVARLGTGLCVTAPGGGASGGGADFVSRYFAPGYGIPEDPVTGSAHCTLAPYWGARLGKSKLRARQLSRRGGDLACELAGDRVLIAGRARLVIKGTLYY
jgi:PhzF family phenazine biosynthesis protein